jgi:Pectate lyase superfamily protein
VEKPIISNFNQLAPLMIQRYERYLPTAFDDSLTMLEKVNKIIEYLDTSGQLTNDLIAQWNEIVEWVMNEGLSEGLIQRLNQMVSDGTFDSIINHSIFADLNTRMDGEGINIMFPPSPLVGAKGDGVTDDSTVIQSIIDYANTQGIRKVFVPAKKFAISKSILLNGCSMYGVHVNIYNSSMRGSAFVALNTGFTAIKQGSLSANDIQFNIYDIMVLNASVGFELLYMINSTYERLYTKDCIDGFLIGNSSSVGAMFCEFNNLWTSGAQRGITIHSKDFFNNNRFNNGFIVGEEHALKLTVTGGYGAVGNSFNNVEFRSSLGRGVILSSVTNQSFNSCYFETGGNAVRMLDYCDIQLNDCTFGLYKKGNNYSDLSYVHSVGGGRISVDGGIIFLTGENDNTSFYTTGNDATYQNIDVKSNISTNGTALSFVRWLKPVNEIAVKKEEQVKASAVTEIPFGSYADITVVYDTAFSKIPEVCIPFLTGANFEGADLSFIRYENLADRCSVRVYNRSASTNRNVSVRVYAKTL